LYISIFKRFFKDFPPIVSFFNFGRAEALRNWGENEGFLEDLGGLDLTFKFLYKVKIFFCYFFLNGEISNNLIRV